MPPKNQKGKAKTPEPQRKAPEQKKPAFELADPSFEVLKHDGRRSPNFVSFRESAMVSLGRTLGDVVKLLRDGVEFVPPPVPAPVVNLTNANDANGMLRAALNTRVAEREKRIARLEEAKPRLFSALWGNMSKDSQAKVKEQRVPVPPALNEAGEPIEVEGPPVLHNDWDDVASNQDPVRLWQRICLSHRAVDTGLAAVNRADAKERYERLRQRADQPISEYKEIFDEALEVLREVEATIEPPADQATRFINSLDPHRYSKFKTERFNAATQGVLEYPATLQDAYDAASTYMVSTSTGRMVGASVFHTNADQANGKKHGGKKGGGKDRPPRESESQSGGGGKDPQVEPNKRNKKACYFCGEPPPTHFASDCPLFQEFKEKKQTEGTWSPAPKNGKVNVCFSTAVIDTSGVILKLTQVGEPVSFNATEMSSVSQPIKTTICLKSADVEKLLDTDVLHDNQATCSIFKSRELLMNLRPADVNCHISGINADGSALVVDTVGDFQQFTGVYYHPSASANILSFSQTAEFCKNGYDRKKQCFTCKPPGDVPTYEFHLKDGLYVYDASHLIVDEQVYGPTRATATVAENKQAFTQRQQKEAERAIEVVRRLASPSPQAVIDIINNGAIINLPVTASDIHRGIEIYGKDLAAVRGKTHKQSPQPIKVDPLPRMISSEVVLNADCMFVEGNTFLITVSEPPGLTMVNDLGRTRGARATPSIRKAMFDQIHQYQSRRFKIRAINTDGEGAIGAIKGDLGALGIELNPTGAGQHVGPIERKIEEVKERARGIKNTLPWLLALTLIPWLIFYCVSRINLVPHKTGISNISPAEAFSGRKIDYKIDLRCSFGDYAEVHDPYADNTLKPRTQAGIALLPTGNRTGSVKFLSLLTGKVVTRDHFTLLPTPDSVIAHMNKVADISYLKAKRQRGEGAVDIELNFAMGDDLNTLEDAVDAVDDPTTYQGVEDLIDMTEDRSDPDMIEDPDQLQQQEVVPDVHRADFPQGQTVLTDSVQEEVTPTPNADTEVSNDSARVQYRSTTDVLEESAEISTAHPYATRASMRGSGERKRYDSKTLQAESIRYASVYHARERSRRHHHAFNIKVRDAIRTMPKEAIRAMYKEITQMVDKKVWTPMRPSIKHQKKVIKSFMFLKEKHFANGEFEKLKARLVAGGHMSDRTLIPDELLSSPTASLPFIYMVAAIAAREGRHTRTADIAGAYLNADISDRNILMELDEATSSILLQIDPTYAEFLTPGRTIVVELKKALYGCVESSKLWYDLLTSCFEAIGYVKNPIDACILNKSVNGIQCTVAIYVDDLLITCKDINMINEVQDMLNKRFENIQMHEGPVHSYLGMSWDFSVSGEVKVTADGYTRDLLDWANVPGTVLTPAASHLFEVRDAEKLAPDKAEWFHSGVAKLLYLAKRTRPDIILPVSFLTTRVQSSDVDDMGKLQRVFKYLNGTADFGIILRPDKDSVTQSAYIDASYGVHADGKSHSGMVLTMGMGPLLVKSNKQKIVTKSSTEAELIALSDLCSPVIWSRDFLAAQGENVPPTVVYQDNMSTMALVDRGGSSSDRTRHIKVRHYWVKDYVDRNEIKIVYLPTERMVADILTKPMQGEQFKMLRNLLLNWKF